MIPCQYNKYQLDYNYLWLHKPQLLEKTIVIQMGALVI